MRNSRPSLLLGYFEDRATCRSDPKSCRDFNEARFSGCNPDGRRPGALNAAAAQIVLPRLQVHPKISVCSEWAKHPLSCGDV